MLTTTAHGGKVLFSVLLGTFFALAGIAALLMLANLLPGAVSAADASGRGDNAGTSSSSTTTRIVTLYQGATDSAIALGLTPIGVVDSWLEKPMYRYLRDALVGVEHVGLETQPNLEKIAWLDPDLVIASDFRHARIAPLLNAIAPTVSAPTVFNFKTTLKMVANATDREAQANALLQQWEARVADFRQQIATKLGSDWPQKVAVVRFKSDHVRIYTSGFAGSILDELGFEQPDTLQSQGWGMKLSSTENIPVMDADAIFILLEPDDPAIADNYQHWASHPLWQQLSAVQNDRVYEVDPVSWMMGGGILAANAMLDDLFTRYELSQPEAAPQVCLPRSIDHVGPHSC